MSESTYRPTIIKASLHIKSKIVLNIPNYLFGSSSFDLSKENIWIEKQEGIATTNIISSFLRDICV